MNNTAFQIGDRVKITRYDSFPQVVGKLGTIVIVDGSSIPYCAKMDDPDLIFSLLWSTGDGDLELVSRPSKAIRNTLPELLEIMGRSHQRENLIYQWVKEDRITFKQFLALLEWVADEQEKGIHFDDSF